MTINVVLNDRVRLHADRLRGAYEIQYKWKKQFSWEKQTQIANEEVENFKQWRLFSEHTENYEFSWRKFQ